MTIYNKIGQFQFIAIHGEPIPPREQLEVIQRPGVDGTGFLQLGKRGDPFEMQTIEDCLSRTLAELQLDEYRTLITSNPVALIRSNYEFPFLVQVLDVQAIGTASLLGSAGGRLGILAAAIVRAKWRLVAVEKPPAEE